MSDKFTHLHVHSEFSLLDGLSKIKELVQRTKDYGQKALALTDHGTMYGAIEFYKECQKQDIKPIIGCEIYTAANSRFDKKRQDASHLILLSLDKQGYENLLKIVSIGHLEGFYYKPRVDKEVLYKYRKGLAMTTACPQGYVQKLLTQDDYSGAKKELTELTQIFGSKRTFVELQRHPYDKFSQSKSITDTARTELKKFFKQTRENEKNLIKLSTELNLKLVATNDSHYVNSDDAPAQDAIVCIQTNKLISDTHRLRYIDTPDFYLKSPDQMAQEFSDIPEAVTNTKIIADMTDLKIKLGEWYFPNFKLPQGKTAKETLREKTYTGAEELYEKVTPEIKRRLEYELKVIRDKGYPAYFLLYADLVGFARKNNIYVNTRGSAAGSLVSYCCKITTVDPIRFNLPFERFLNPFRPSAPDIDLDVPDDHRDDFIAYLKQEHGDDKVAQICTFGTMKAKAAVRDIGRVLGFPYSQVDRVSKLIPLGSQGFPMTLKKALKISNELKKAYDSESDTKKIIDLAKKIEGNVRHISVHAAAVVVAPKELPKYTPLQLETGGGDKVITQYEMHACEDVGLIKLDILGIRNLSILANAVKIIKALHNKTIDVHTLPLDDKKTFDILAKGETFGVFQLASSGMTKYLVELKPERIEDIMQMVALYRPGPISFIPEYIKRKHNPKLVKYFDPRVEKFLKSSYGIIVYQDDVLYTAIELAGYDWGEVDKFRKAIGKKIPEEMEKQHKKFVDGCISGGITKEKAEEIFSQIETFAAYGFNKAHAASYGMVAYWTAYTKAHYPVEYMSALMSAEANNTDKLTEAILECDRLGIKILPPDVNESLTGFTIIKIKKTERLSHGRAKGTGQAIRFGLGAIKNVGNSAIDAILEARKKQRFQSFGDFLLRANPSKVNKRVVEALILSGALDKFGKRAALLEALPEIKNKLARLKRPQNGQTSLFKASSQKETVSDQLPDVEEFPMHKLLKEEKKLLGFYLTENPAKSIMASVEDKITHRINQVDPSYHSQQTVTVAGILTGIREVNTKKNNSLMAFGKLEDDTGSIELVIFPKIYKDTKDLWVEDKGLLITGKVDNKDDTISILVNAVKPVSVSDTSPNTSLKEIKIPRGTSRDKLLQVSQLLKQNSPGEDNVVILIPNGDTPKKIPLPYSVNLTASLISQIHNLLQTPTSGTDPEEL